MALDQKIVSELEVALGKDSVSTAPSVLYTYGFDASIYHHSPDVVVLPTSTEQVSQVMKIAYAHGIPVTPRGSGTGLCGAAVPIKGGILLSTQKMDKVLNVSVKDVWVDVQAGCIYNKLNDELAEYGFFFPPSPGSAEACTVGGMVATNASGMRAVKYGATRDFVLGLTFVKADGSIVHAGTRTIKDASGYQLARFMCGSEGTLGVITEITFKLTTKPKKSAYCLCSFDSVLDAGRCISAIIGKPLIPASCELMDKVSIDAVNKVLGNPLPQASALIIVEADGETDEVVEMDLKIIAQVASENNAVSVTPSHDKAEIQRWTNARKSVLASLSALKPGYDCVSLADDMGVPISKVPDAVERFQEISERHGVTVATYGHASDGNLHTKMVIRSGEKDDWDRAFQTVDEIFDVCIELGGTVTGEHGVGISKAENFKKERADEIDTLVAIKRAMDPKNILNPGKGAEFDGDRKRGLRYPCPEYQRSIGEPTGQEAMKTLLRGLETTGPQRLEFTKERRAIGDGSRRRCRGPGPLDKARSSPYENCIPQYKCLTNRRHQNRSCNAPSRNGDVGIQLQIERGEFHSGDSDHGNPYGGAPSEDLCPVQRSNRNQVEHRKDGVETECNLKRRPQDPPVEELQAEEGSERQHYVHQRPRNRDFAVVLIGDATADVYRAWHGDEEPEHRGYQRKHQPHRVDAELGPAAPALSHEFVPKLMSEETQGGDDKDDSDESNDPSTAVVDFDEVSERKVLRIVRGPSEQHAERCGQDGHGDSDVGHLGPAELATPRRPRIGVGFDSRVHAHLTARFNIKKWH